MNNLPPVKVLSRTELPASPPFFQTIVVWILLDYVGAPWFAAAPCWVLIALMWLAFIVRFSREEHVRLREIGGGHDENP